jgi:hypothetical protein
MHRSILYIMTFLTLTWFDLITIFGFLGTIVGISLKVGRVLQKLDVVIEDVKKIEKSEYIVRLAILEGKCAELEKKLVSDNRNSRKNYANKNKNCLIRNQK